MARDREQLQVDLNRLLLAVPRYLRAMPDPADYWPAIAGQADDILDAAGAEDHDWANDQIWAILKRYNLTPGD